MTEFLYNALGFMVEKIFLPIFILFLALLIVCIPFWIYEKVKENECCSAWGSKIVHQEAYTSYIYTGKVMVPIYHPAGDYPQNVCIDSKPSCKQ